MTEARPDDIVQIIPADGWFAVYRDDNGAEYRTPLVAWALQRDGIIAPYDTDERGTVEPVNRTDSSFVRIERTIL